MRHAVLGIIPDSSVDESHVGVLIQGTTPGEPAALAGLQGGDLLVQIGEYHVANLDDLTNALAKLAPGASVGVKILRGRQSLDVNVILAGREGAGP